MARNDTVFQKITGGPEEQAVWLTLPPWSLPDDLTAALPAGVTIRDGKAFAKDVSGLTVAVIAGCRPDAPPRADWEVAARRALEAALAERGAQLVAELTSLRARAKAAGITVAPPTSTPCPTGTTPAGDTPKER